MGYIASHTFKVRHNNCQLTTSKPERAKSILAIARSFASVLVDDAAFGGLAEADQAVAGLAPANER